MELGLTFPLQRFLGIKTPAWGTEPDRRFCWDLHVIRLRGRGCLVAFLNRAWEDVLALDLCLDMERQAQPLLDRAVNTCSSRCAGFEGLGTGLERISASLL